MLTVFGFKDEKLFERKTCKFDVVIAQVSQTNTTVNLEMFVDPVADTPCLHRDRFSVALWEETEKSLIRRDNLFMSNLEALESTLTEATFRDQGVDGTWYVSDEDLYMSSSLYKKFFKVSNDATAK